MSPVKDLLSNALTDGHKYCCKGHLPPTTSTSASLGLRPFIHNRLNNARKQIRLLEILPGEPQEWISINILTVSLASASQRQYTALSYAWGEREYSAHLTVAGDKVFSVSRHVESALKKLRYRDRHRLVWIDALSICQSDPEERGRQVLLMRDIYTGAQEVIVWLGESDHSGSRAFQLLTDFGSLPAVRLLDNTIAESRNEQERAWIDSYNRISLCQTDVLALVHFFANSWFNRVWILQEAALPKPENIVFMSSSSSLSWFVLEKAINALVTKGVASESPKENLEALFHGIHRANVVLSAKKQTAIGLFHLGQASECTDPKDKVYGMLGLMEVVEGDLKITPDYGNSLSEVYRDLVWKMICHQKRADILANFELAQTVSEESTWASPVPRRTVGMLRDAADGWTRSEARLLAPGVLRVAGVCVGTVKNATPFPQTISRAVELFAHEVTKNLSTCGTQGRRPEDNNSAEFEAYCTTIVAGLVAEACSQPNALPLQNVVDCVNYYLRVLCTGDQQADEPLLRSLKQFSFAFLNACEGRTFITTSDGHMGLGPPEARRGDDIVVVLGCRQHLVARKVPGGYRLVGECYIYGFQHGEGLFGELPSGWRRKIGKNQILHQYVNDATGETTEIDPRLRRLVRRESQLRLKWIGTAPHYPLLTAKHLQKHGVQIVKFDLI
ncbi:uncharacterized protein PV09_07477 [Verruconis gallopava]|uniref:WW domain-containing protein n=1 Tax=Verruconis gallopava TaxID=253628 RepID=A0A0D1XFH1_9PEZI|nr:uncharacterized protein PV09_07477 [Verruconis gallopava]KIW00951.1 hypothetical protein PV09_07477 [Verruconis gallopava]